MSTKRVWKKGPPPHVGWWNASFRRDIDAWRWWNGAQWSRTMNDIDNPAFAKMRAATPADMQYQGHIEWTHHWPEGARVARINPMTGEATGKGPLS